MDTIMKLIGTIAAVCLVVLYLGDPASADAYKVGVTTLSTATFCLVVDLHNKSK